MTDMLYQRPATLPPLSIREVLGKEVATNGVGSAVAQYRKAKAERPGDFRLEEIELNMLGYDLMWAGRTDDAAVIQRLNLEVFPGSANAYDSYGDALLAKGDTANALENFKKCYAMDSTFTGTKEKIDAIEAAAVPKSR